MSSCRAVPWTSLATAARWSPAAGMSTTTTVAPSRCRVRAIAAPMPRAAPVTTATLPASGLSTSAGSCPAPELTVRNCPSTNADRPDRKNRSAPSAAGAGGAGAVGEQDAVAGGAGAEFLGQRPQQPVHALPGRRGGRVGACRRRARETVTTRPLGARSRREVAAVRTGFSRSLGVGQFVQDQDDGAELLLGYRMAADVQVPGQEGRRRGRRRRCRSPAPGPGRRRGLAGLIAPEGHGLREAELLGDVPAEALADQLGVFVGHRIP